MEGELVRLVVVIEAQKLAMPPAVRRAELAEVVRVLAA